MTHPPIHQHTTFLYTRDLDATASFYEDVMDLQMVLDQDDCRIYRVGRDAFLGFCERDDAPVHPHGVILTIVTKEVDRWHRYLVERGVEFEKEPAFHPAYDIYHCLFRDPSGYLIEIQRFEDPTWEEVASR